MDTSSGEAVTRKQPSLWWKIVERYRWASRRNKIALWCLLAAIIIGAISLQWLHPAYRSARMWFFLRMAEGLVEKKDYSAASLAYRKAILSGMEFTDSWKSLAKFLDKIGSPDVIDVWERLAGMEPENPTYRFNEAEAAVRFNRIYQAQDILDGIPQKWRNEPEYLSVAADVAIKRNFIDLAEDSLLKLLKQRPQDEKERFALLRLQSVSADQQKREAAIEALQKWAEGRGELADESLRQLITLSSTQGDYVSADLLATKLIARPNATVRDRLWHMQLEVMSQSLSQMASVVALRTYAEKNPEVFEQVMTWFLATKLDLDGLAAWVKGLPDSLTSQPPVKWGLLQYYLHFCDWDRVFALLGSMDSQIGVAPISIDFAQKALKQFNAGDLNAEQTWIQAIYAAKGSVVTLRILDLLAAASGWSAADGRVLSALTEVAPQQAAFWQALAVHEKAARNLAGYFTAMQGLMKINPYDIDVASQWAIASILLRKSTDYSDILKIADRTYRSTSPANPDAGIAYAMALFRSNRPKEALDVVERMSLRDRRDLRRAIFVGTILAANGQKQEALDNFARTEGTDVAFFGEEKLLRSVWEGVAKGEATTEQAAEQLIAQRMKDQGRSAEINDQLRKEMESRSNPAEVQRILSELKAEQENRRKAPPVDISKLLKEADSD